MEVVMSEQLPEPEAKENRLYGRTSNEWHTYLTTHEGEPTGHLATPGSRYGDDAEECAWWAVAGLCVYFHEFAEVDDAEALAYEVMGYVVNDQQDVMADVLSYTHLVPADVLANLTVPGVKAWESWRDC